MQPISDVLSTLKLGAPQSYRNLAVFPLFAPGGHLPEYLTLDEALEAKLARVTEVSDTGSVPELRFENDANAPVLLVDGEELIGARQNRVLNLTILVGASSHVVVPVSCVERGRWAWKTRHFASAKRNLFAKARAKKMGQVTQSLRTAGMRASDQAAIWSDIDEKSASLRVSSGTDAMGDVYEQREAQLKDYRDAFAAEDFQVGAVFAVDGEVAGLELFDSPVTFRKFMTKLVDSYALDAIEAVDPAPVVPVEATVRRFLDDMERAVAESFSALGEGEDLRLTGDNLAGGALVALGRVLHLAAFPIAKPVEA